jgi:hypothetical protein
VAAHDEQLRRFGLLQQLVRRAVAHQHLAHSDVGIGLAKAGQAFGDDALTAGRVVHPLDVGELVVDVVPGVHGDQVDAAQGCLLERDRDRLFGGRGAVDPDHDGSLVGVLHKRVFIVDHRDRTLGVVHDGGAHRAEQPPTPGTEAAAADDDHVGVLGHVDQRRLRLAGDDLPHHREGPVLGGPFGDRRRLRHDALAAFGLPAQILRRGRHLDPHLQVIRRDDVGECERDPAPGGVACRPIRRDLAGRGPVDTDNDAVRGDRRRHDAPSVGLVHEHYALR